MSEEKLSLRIKKFERKDFPIWKIRVENALNASQCLEAIEENFVKIETNEDGEEVTLEEC